MGNNFLGLPVAGRQNSGSFYDVKVHAAGMGYSFHNTKLRKFRLACNHIRMWFTDAGLGTTGKCAR
jgi:hypothetical protein